MLTRRVEQEWDTGNTNASRLFGSFVPYLTRDLPDLPSSTPDAGQQASSSTAASNQPTLMPSSPGEAMAAFLESWRFDGPNERGGGRVEPLLCAACLGDAGLVRSLLAAKADANRKYTGAPIPQLFLMGGATALHYAVAIAEDAETIEALLRAGADLDARAGAAGATPLHVAAGLGAAKGIRALKEACMAAGRTLRVDLGTTNDNGSALLVAAHLGNPDSVRALLLDLGANVRRVNSNGSTVWTAACDNVRMDLPTLELLLQRFGADAATEIVASRRARTLKWRAISATCELFDRIGFSSGELVRAFAHNRGATPLHHAASRGNQVVVRWLLQHGAMSSLQARNARGRTPLDMARLCGPFPAVEAELEAAQRQLEAAQAAVISAAQQGNQQAMSLLIEYDMQPPLEQCASLGLAPLDRAQPTGGKKTTPPADSMASGPEQIGVAPSAAPPDSSAEVERPEPLWVLRVTDLLALSGRMPSHDDLMAQGKLIAYEPRAAPTSLIYVAYEGRGPGCDISTAQLGTLERTLLRMRSGAVHTLTNPYSSEGAGPAARTCITPRTWKALVEDAVVWVAAASLPQMPSQPTLPSGHAVPGTARSATARLAALKAASCMLVICPSEQPFVPERSRGLGSWLGSWSGRLEQLALTVEAYKGHLIASAVSIDGHERSLPAPILQPAALGEFCGPSGTLQQQAGEETQAVAEAVQNITRRVATAAWLRSGVAVGLSWRRSRCPSRLVARRGGLTQSRSRLSRATGARRASQTACAVKLAPRSCCSGRCSKDSARNRFGIRCDRLPTRCAARPSRLSKTPSHRGSLRGCLPRT